MFGMPKKDCSPLEPARPAEASKPSESNAPGPELPPQAPVCRLTLSASVLQRIRRAARLAAVRFKRRIKRSASWGQKLRLSSLKSTLSLHDGALFAAGLFSSGLIFFFGLFGRPAAALAFTAVPAAAAWGLNRFKRSRTGEPLVFSDALLMIGALRSGAAGAKACRRAAEVLLLAALIPLFLAALCLRIEPTAASAWPWRLLLTLLPLVLWSAGLALLLGSAAFRQTLLARLPLTFDAQADAARWGAAGAMPLHLASLIERGQAVLDAVKKPQAEPPVVIDPKRLRLHGEPRHLLLICAEGLDLSAALDGAAPLAPTLAALARRSPSGRLAGERPPAAGGFEFEVLTGLSAETLEAWSFAPLRLAHAEKVQSPVWTERRLGRRTAAWLPLEADWLRLEAALPHLGFEAVWGLERINRWHSAAYGGQLPRLPCGLPDAEALLMSAADFLESAKDPHFLYIELPRPASQEAARELLASLDAGTRRFVERISGRELLVRGMLCGGGRWLFLRGGAQHEDRILPREALLAELFGSARRPAAAHSEVLSEE